MNMFPHADGRSRSQVQAEPLVKMGNLTRLLLVAGGFLGSEETMTWDVDGGDIPGEILGIRDTSGFCLMMKLQI